MVQSQEKDKWISLFETVYAFSGLTVLFFFNSIQRSQELFFSSDTQLCAISLAMVGIFQLLALWFARKQKSWSVIVMSLLSTLAIPTILISIPVLSHVDGWFSRFIAVLMFILNVVSIGLVSQDSITSKLLNRHQIHENDGPVLIVVLLHTLIGSFLFILNQFELLPRVTDMTILGTGLVNAISSISMLFLLLIIFLIIRLRYAWILFLVLDILLLTLGFATLITAFQLPGQLILPTAYYGIWILSLFEDVALACITSGIALLLALVYNIPALDTKKKVVSLNEEHHED